MKIPAPWSPDPDAWKTYVAKASTPGIEPEEPKCRAPAYGTPPVVHRFHELFLTEESPIELRTQNEFPLLESRDENPCTPCPEERCIRPWEIQGIQWGIFVVYEQAWQWKGNSLGELIDSISLAPLEEFEIQVFTWDRTKLSRDLETTDLVDKKGEISLTTHDSSQVLNRMEKERQWQFGANVGFEYGITAGAQVSAGESVKDLAERRREQKQELTSKTAQQVRSERKLKISTVREMGVEERTRRLLKNPNPTRSVTYNFYETLSHYQVDIAPVEVRWVIAIPNELPKITPCWVVCHEGNLREQLLDQTQEPGFEAARRLAVEAAADPVLEAARRLHGEFLAQPGAPAHEGDPGPEPQDTPERRERPGSADLGAAAAGIALLGPLGLLLLPALAPARAEVPSSKPPSFWTIARFLEAVTQHPSIAGLAKSLEMLRDWYTPWREGGLSMYYELTPGMEGALALATAAVVYETQEIPQIPEGDEAAQQAAKEAWLTWKSKKEEALRNLRENQAAFDGLKCHIEQNLLHYMRSLWLAEDPSKRRAILSQRLFKSGMNLLDPLIDEPLLGFHLNCSVFPVKMDAELEAKLRAALSTSEEATSRTISKDMKANSLRQFVEAMQAHGKQLKGRINDHFSRLANSRFQADAMQILNDSVSEGVRHVLTCKNQGEKLTPDLLPEVMTFADGRVSTILNRFQDKEDWDLYLKPAERKQKNLLEDYAKGLEATKVNTEDESTTLRNLVGVLRAGTTVTAERDFKPIIVTLPDGGYHCEPIVGHCSAAEPLRQRELEAEVAQREIEVERRRQRIEAGNLEADPNTPTFNINLDESS
jgi:hypothetical protein